MKRRQLMQYAGVSLLTAMGITCTAEKQVSQAQTTSPSLTIKWLGHTCFLFTSKDLRILVNPFRTLGCTAGYRLPEVEADVVLISSQLLDEGATGILPGKPRILFQPGVFRIDEFQFQGIGVDHDREQGYRFGTNVVWRWSQGGISILHLGGAAAPIEIEQKILMGTPDLALVPVGGGVKAYNPEEAKQAILTLNPKLVIPTHYLTAAADKDNCELAPVENFLQLMNGTPISRVNGNLLTLIPKDLPKTGSMIKVFDEKNTIQPPTPTPSPQPTPENKPSK